MYTDKMRYTGTSGIDTQSMITQLMKAESMKLYKYQRSTQLIQWKQDAYRNIATDLTAFQKTHFDFLSSKINMLSEKAYKNSSSTVKSNGVDSNAVSIKSTTGAVSGNYKLEVLNLASTEKFVGTKELKSDIVSSTSVNASALKEGDSFNVALDGSSKTITFSSSDISNIGGDVAKLAVVLQTKMDEAFGTENGSSKVSVTNIGDKLSFAPLKGHEIKLSEAKGRTSTLDGISAFDTAAIQDKDSVDFTVTSSDGNTPIPVTVKLKNGEAMTAQSFASAINAGLSEAKVSGLSASVDSEGKIVFKSTNSTNDLRIEDSDGDFASLSKLSSDFTLGHTSVLSDLKIGSGTLSKLDTSKSVSDTLGIGANDPIDFIINGVKIDGLTGSSSMKELLDKMNNGATGVKVNYDELTKNFTMETTKQGSQNNIQITQEDMDELNTLFGFNKTSGYTQAEDAMIKLNGITTTRTSNNFTINDISLELKEVTNGQIIDINVSKDNTTTFDNIKNFVDEYNKMIDSLNKMGNEKSVRSSSGKAYNPLTDDEKKAMKEDEIKKWEDKAKEGLLYNDPIIRQTLSSLRSSLYESVELSSGKTLSLFQLGITTTSDYKDGGKLQIDEAKLKKYLDENPDDVAELFTKSSSISSTDKANSRTRMKEQGLALRINEIINNTAGRTGLIAEKAGLKDSLTESKSVLSKQLLAEQTRMVELNKYLADKENYYYSMFSKMEVAMTRANSQMSYMMAQFG